MDARNNPEGGTGLMDKVREGATSQLSSQKDRATEGIGSVAQAIRQSTQHLRDNQHETIAQYVDQAANQLEQFSNRLKQKDVSELLRDAQQLAKKRPAVFIGSAFAIGLLGARFLKSSRERESGYRAGMSGSRGGGNGDVYGVRGGDYARNSTSSPGVTASFDDARGI
jgi:hypothetical protein